MVAGSADPRETDDEGRAPRDAGDVADQLVEAVVAGEPGAWEALVEKYERLVLAVPIRMGLSRADAEEVFQDTWLTLCEQIRSIRTPRSLGSWIVTTASREAWRCLRRRERERSQNEGEPVCALDSLPEPSELLAELELAGRVTAAIEELRPRCRQLLRRLFYEGAGSSYEEIARSLNVAPGSIGPTRQRCLAQLAHILERQGPAP